MGRTGAAGAPGISGADGSAPRKSNWSSNKNERQALLQRRREEMILTARRKLEERDRVEKGKEKERGVGVGT